MAERRKKVLLVVIGVLAIGGVTLGLSKLKPAAPPVDGGTIWRDTVKRGTILRDVRGIGTLVPEQIRWIPAETDAQVEEIKLLPGVEQRVKKDSVIMRLSNPQVEQEAMDADLQLRAAEAELKNTKVKVQSDLMTLKAGAATVESDHSTAQRQAEIDAQLEKLGVISGTAAKTSASKAQEMATRDQIEKQRIQINTEAVESQVAVQQAKVEELRALAALKKKQLDALTVRAGIDGILQEVPVQVGQRVTPGTTLAKVAQPEHLKAELKVAETQAKDVQVGQKAQVDTHNGVIEGRVMRVDPAVQNGTVTVDVQLLGELPKGARPDLSVDGTISLENMADVLYMGRPAFGQESSSVGIFKIEPDGKTAVRVPVKLGRGSVNAIEIVGGLKEGDQVILSDMSRYDNVDRVRIE